VTRKQITSEVMNQFSGGPRFGGPKNGRPKARRRPPKKAKAIRGPEGGKKYLMEGMPGGYRFEGTVKKYKHRIRQNNLRHKQEMFEKMFKKKKLGPGPEGGLKSNNSGAKYV